MSNWQIWLAIIATGCGLIWALFQHNKKKKIRQQERASQIADDFADNLMDRFTLISNTLASNAEINDMVSKVVNSKKLHHFNNMEISEILNNKNCYKRFYEIVHSDTIQESYEQILNNSFNEKEKEKFESKFSRLVEVTLNHLEAKCINISSHAAGSQFIYNSLHQPFLYTVELLSVLISGINMNNIDCYYTNIITVYNMWNKQKSIDLKKLQKTNNKLSKINHKAKKEVCKLLNKKNATV